MYNAAWQTEAAIAKSARRKWETNAMEKDEHIWAELIAW